MDPSDNFIPVANPRANLMIHYFEIEDAIRGVLLSGRYILGEEVENFEREFAGYLGTKFCIGVASGTDALSLALIAVGVSKGDEVITVSHSSVATVAAIEKIGAIPVFIDIYLPTYNMDAYRIRDVISKATKAIVPVHIYGQSCPIERIMLIASKYDLKVVEDCAQAVGAEYEGRKLGTFGNAAAFSFYPTKNLGAIGDGGAVVTNNQDVAEKVHLLREYGWKKKQISSFSGWNSRLDELQASILRVKLRYISDENTRRRKIAKRYREVLDEKCIVSQKSINGTLSAEHLFVIRCESYEERCCLQRFLLERNIDTALHYPEPIHQQPAYYRRIKGWNNLLNTERLCNEILTLPMYAELTDEEVDRICGALREWIAIPPITWKDIEQKSCINLYAGDVPPLKEYLGWIGLSLNKSNRTHILHDIIRPIPLPDSFVDLYQSEDVFEHISYDVLVPIMDEIYRILKPGGLFRLSVPDYGCDVLYNRSVKDESGKITFDKNGGGDILEPGHKWFPRIDSVQYLIKGSRFKEATQVEFLHYYNMDGSYVTKSIDYSKGLVTRTPDFDDKVKDPYRPLSLVVDLIK